jgi:hypothetical protein
MATTLKISEVSPAIYPALSTPVSLPPGVSIDAVWRRIEDWTAYRWGARDAVFIVEGPGNWTAPVLPTTFDVTEIWRDDAWEAVTLRPTALGGLFLPELAHYRIAATVGADDAPPPAVEEAVRRLAQYFGNVAINAQQSRLASGFKLDDVDVQFSEPHVAAKAMKESGAADLLRRYRLLGAC